MPEGYFRAGHTTSAATKESRGVGERFLTAFFLLVFGLLAFLFSQVM
jgi:hypothetical protein